MGEGSAWRSQGECQGGAWRSKECTQGDSYVFEAGLVIYWSHEDQAFLVEVPELPGCTADGQSYEEAVTKAQLVIEEWIQTVQELGRTYTRTTR
jgi:predicted RNase H-like HicB family nuclease